MNAATLWETRNRRTCVLLILAILLTAVFSTACVSGGETRARIDNARRSISAALMSDLNRCARIGLKMTYAGADIRNTLLPELKMRFFAVEKMNQALRDGFGEAFTPVSEQLIYRIGNAITRLEDAYRSGSDAGAAEASLAAQVMELNAVLQSRFDKNGDVLRAPAR